MMKNVRSLIKQEIVLTQTQYKSRMLKKKKKKKSGKKQIDFLIEIKILV